MWQTKRLTKQFFKTPKDMLKKGLILLLFLLVLLFVKDWMIEDDGVWTPNYPKIDLEHIVDKKELTEADYHRIFLQTGLGEEAVDELRLRKVGENRERAFFNYQDAFFSSGNYECRLVSSIVFEERIRDKEGNLMVGFEIPSLKNGDILITKATHSAGWRHGHAAIVVDAAKGETLEAIVLGNPSATGNILKWQTYPSFIVLRLKEENQKDAEKIAEFAYEKILGVPYGLLTGIPEKAPDKIKKTQCAHLVWYPYEKFGYDIDSDGSWLVTPKDIVSSDLLEVVQVYGVNPEKLWP